jgi:hypothetical protein
MLYVLYAGLKGRSDRRAAIAAAVVAGESLIFHVPLLLLAVLLHRKNIAACMRKVACIDK